MELIRATAPGYRQQFLADKFSPFCTLLIIPENVVQQAENKRMKFRKATKSDVSKIVEMIVDDELGKSRENFQVPLPGEYLDAFKRINADQNQELIVVENENSEIIGTLQLSFIQYLTYRAGIRAQIEAVRIKKGHRGIGLGKKIFEWAIERAKERKAHLLQLTTDKKRPKQLSFIKTWDSNRPTKE